MSTLVVCVDRSNDISRKAGLELPVAGWEAVHALVTDVGLADPEDSSVNCLLESLRVARDLRDEQEEAVVAVVGGVGDSLVGTDRSVAAQLDDLIERYDLDSAIVVIDSAQDERIVPIVESRLPIHSVDRVVVRQAHDIESTYYLLKQFLGDEELRSTVLVPLGIGLLLLPLLLTQFGPQVALAALASLLGAVLLYKGLAIDDRLATAVERARDALYSGQVSIVTYVVAAGLALVGVFLGALAVRDIQTDATYIRVLLFSYRSVPWLALAALTASTGRVLDEFIQSDGLSAPYLNLPFGVLAVGLVVRGFTGYFLEQESILGHLQLPNGVFLSPIERLAIFVVSGLVVSLLGVSVTARMRDETLDDVAEQ
ncbi:putative membrane protein [Halogranum rubrum]|uniref:Putative membrane protein n=1 Tax=Halogranum rubrum TaxID=553466 RepID=A0A1I4EEQ8_9EURY|nr:DUF373 family protein [Halogranum rubrum]SFL04268.1 putative membrane protein [Halogranum rubrum]